MSFKTEGTFDVTITDAFITDAKFQPKDGERNNQGVPVETYYDVCIQVANVEGDSDIWRGEMSNRNGVGNNAQLYRTDLTLKTLQEIGFCVQSMTDLENQFVPANDRSISIPNLVGLKCTVTIERREYEDRNGVKKSINFIKYLNALGSGHAKRLSFDDFMNRRRGAAPATPATPPAAPAYAQGPTGPTSPTGPTIAPPAPQQVPPQQYQAPATPAVPQAAPAPASAYPANPAYPAYPSAPQAPAAPAYAQQSVPPPAAPPSAPAYAQSPTSPTSPTGTTTANPASPACPY